MKDPIKMIEGEIYRPIPEPPTREELNYEMWVHFGAHDEWVRDGSHHGDREAKCVLTSLYEKYAKDQ